MAIAYPPEPIVARESVEHEASRDAHETNDDLEFLSLTRCDEVHHDALRDRDAIMMSPPECPGGRHEPEPTDHWLM